jgi:hypothetical protein
LLFFWINLIMPCLMRIRVFLLMRGFHASRRKTHNVSKSSFSFLCLFFILCLSVYFINSKMATRLVAFKIRNSKSQKISSAFFFICCRHSEQNHRILDILNESRNGRGDKPNYRTQTFIERDSKYIAL